LVDAAEGDLKTFILLTWGASLRIGEVLGLDRSSVNMKTGKVAVTQQWIVLPKVGLTLDKPKNGRTRNVALFAEAVAALKAHYGDLPVIGDAPVLTNANGGRVSRRALYAEWNDLRVEVGLPDLHVHDLRHLSLTLYAQGGATIRELLERAGHSKPETVMIYQHLASNRDSSLIDNVARLTARA
jgi:integrase